MPEGKLPKKKMKAEGIRPRDPPLEHHPSIRTIREELGGAFARADASGNFSVMVPQPGKYYLLIISRHADRPRNADIDEADLAQIQQYFNLPQALISRRKYYWALKEIHIGASPIEHDFGRGGQQ